MDLTQLRADWERLSTDDPMWAVLTEPDKKGTWEVGEFFETGRREVDTVMGTVDELVPDLAHGDALDFGCGVGRLTQALAEHFASVTGVDIAEPMITQARHFNQHGDRCRFVHNTGGDLATFADASMDLVYSSIVLQHIPSEFARGYLREFARVLRPGGVATFTLPSHPARTLRGTAFRVTPFGLLNAWRRRRHGTVMEMNRIKRSDVEALLASAGLSVLRVDRDDSAGRHWVTYRYYALRDGGQS